jgi:hypothetical protein
MTVIRSVSKWRESDGKPRDNHNTWSAFAKMLGLLPTSAVTETDLDLIPGWLSGRFDRSMTGYSIASGTLRHFLTSDKPEDWGKACRILYHCTAIDSPTTPQAAGSGPGKRALSSTTIGSRNSSAPARQPSARRRDTPLPMYFWSG